MSGVGNGVAPCRTQPDGPAQPAAVLFAGQYHESGLAGAEGLYYYNARKLALAEGQCSANRQSRFANDPALGRFTQADTIVPQPGNP